MRSLIFLIYFCLIFSGIGQAQQFTDGLTGDQWELTFDTIRAKVNGLLERNNQLSAQYQQVKDAQDKTLAAINEQEAKNAAMRQFLKERHGRSDQQVRQDELESRLKLKKTQLAVRQGQALDLKDRLTAINNTVALKKIRIADLELRHNMPAPAQELDSGDSELDALRQQLEDEKAKEVTLEDEVSSNAKAVAHPEMGLLQEKLDFLTRQKQELLQGTPVDIAARNKSEIDRKMYFAAIEQKAKLESRIHQFEDRINMLKNSSGVSVSWEAQKKKLVHEVVTLDARNTQLREKINNIRQDIALLKEQVGLLQKQVNK